MKLTMNKLFNPFKEIAGSKALFWGLLVMLFTGLTGYFSNTHFPDVISVKYIPENMPLGYYFVQQLVIWMIPSLIFYALAIIGSSSSIRAIDILGTQALARYPYLVVAATGFSGSLKRFTGYIMAVAVEQKSEATISAFDLVMAVLIMLFSLLLLVWLVALMYNAFRVSANLKGNKAVGLFIAGFVLSMAVTILVGMQIYPLWK